LETVAIVASDDDSLGDNSFSCCCGDKEAEECDFHGCVPRLHFFVLYYEQKCMAEYCSSKQRGRREV
jgi:hypothetical protein